MKLSNIMKTTFDYSRRIVTRLLVLSLLVRRSFSVGGCLCCLAFSPLIGAEEAAGQAATVPALTATNQTAADALIAKHRKAALLHCRMWVDKDATESVISNTVEYLVSKGADVNAKNKPGNTPLHLAARLNNDVDVIKCLVDNGADVHAKNNRGETPLHDAARENINGMVYKFLVSKGADADAADNKGLTPRSLKK